MKRLRGAPGATLLTILCGVAMTAPAAADTGDALLVVSSSRPSPWAVTFSADSIAGDAAAVHPIRLSLSTAGLLTGTSAEAARQDPAGPPASADGQGTARTTAFVYSDGYNRRRKIHYIASFATIPLFATQYVLGKKLYDGTGSDGTRSAHQAVAAGVGVLFGVNTVTGVWNLVEARKNPSGRTKRLAHGILMLAADAGFVATAALAPGQDGSGDRTAHRAVALTSVALATTGYLIMLFGR
jgi:hypothetical protein